MPFSIVREDICRIHADAIVNAANEDLLEGGGVCGAIFAAAGRRRLTAACRRIGHVDTGAAVATKAFSLPARHIIHTAGPIWRGGGYGEEEALRSCYRSSLELAKSLEDTSIAFPLISSGIYGYPKDQAVQIALEEISRFLETEEFEVTLAVFDRGGLSAAERHADVERYIDDVYVDNSAWTARARWEMSEPSFLGKESLPSLREPEADSDSYSESMSASEPMPMAKPSMPPAPTSSPRFGIRKQTRDLDTLLEHLDRGFSDTLMALIDERGMKDSEVYKRANMSRQHFSKIRSNRSYQPKKPTVLALAIALRLNCDEAQGLLGSAGYTLSHADKRDVIVEYYLANGVYDIAEINLTLFDYQQPILK